jgi:hypothetical protein
MQPQPCPLWLVAAAEDHRESRGRRSRCGRADLNAAFLTGLQDDEAE